MISEEENCFVTVKRKRGRQPKSLETSVTEAEQEKKERTTTTKKYNTSKKKSEQKQQKPSNAKRCTDPLKPWRDSCLYVITPQTFFSQRDDNDWDCFVTSSSSSSNNNNSEEFPSSSLSSTKNDHVSEGKQNTRQVSSEAHLITDERIRIALQIMIKYHDETCISFWPLQNAKTTTTTTTVSNNPKTSQNFIITSCEENNTSSTPSSIKDHGGIITDQPKTTTKLMTTKNKDEVRFLSPLWNIENAFSSLPSLKTLISSSSSSYENSLDSCPSVIYATYSYDLNIIKIHEAIRAKFITELKSIGHLKLEAENLRKKQLKNVGTTIVERKDLGRRAKEIEEKILKIETNEEWLRYVEKAKPILEKYVKVASEEALGIVVIGLGRSTTTRPITTTTTTTTRRREEEKRFEKCFFEGRDDDFAVDDSSETSLSSTSSSSSGSKNDAYLNKKERLLIIEEYLKVAGEYINIHVIPIQTETIRCPICNLKQEDASNNTTYGGGTNDDHGTFVCDCGRETICVARSATFRDSARIDTGVKNAYEDLANFIKRLDAFEGKQRSPPPSCLYDQLENFFVSKPLECRLTSAQIRELPLDENGKKKGTSIPLLEEALLRTNNSAFYKDVELIAHKFWGWKIADISSSGLRRTLIADYIATQKVYDTIKERESSLNVNLRLYFHLKARDFPCELSDFKIVSSRDSLEYHSRMFEIMCERTGLKFTPII